RPSHRMPAMNYLPLNLTIAGVLLLGLGILHVALPVVLQWNRELAGASPLNREVSYVHCFFIGLACLLWGLLPLTAGRSLLQPSPGGIAGAGVDVAVGVVAVGAALESGGQHRRSRYRATAAIDSAAGMNRQRFQLQRVCIVCVQRCRS
ncbi:MAG: hypothetical protein ACHQIO_20760, partial [Nevskiales bacterium]